MNLSAGQATKGSGGWSSHILGQNKRDVLSDLVLPIILACNPMAKIALDFRERLEAATATAGAADATMRVGTR